jgi:hypothetical protein
VGVHDLRKFTADEEENIDHLLSHKGRPDKVLAVGGSAVVTRQSAQRLGDGTWLNGETIGYMGALLSEAPSGQKVLALTSFAIAREIDVLGGENRGPLLARGIDLWAHDTILMPTNVGQMHWSLTYIEMRSRVRAILRLYARHGQHAEADVEADTR